MQYDAQKSNKNYLISTQTCTLYEVRTCTAVRAQFINNKPVFVSFFERKSKSYYITINFFVFLVHVQFMFRQYSRNFTKFIRRTSIDKTG